MSNVLDNIFSCNDTSKFHKKIRKIFMNNDRTLSFNRAKKLSMEDIQDVSAAGMTSSITTMVTYNPSGEMDMCYDITP